MTRSIREVVVQEPGPFVHGDKDSTSVDETMLGQAVSASLKSISRRNKGKEKSITTSLRDLDLARKPASTHYYPDTFSRTPQPTTSGQPLTSYPHSERMTQSTPSKKRTGNAWARNSAIHTTSQNQPVPTDMWGLKVDLKPVEFDAVTNPYASPALSDTSQASKASIQPLHSGRGFLGNPSERPHPLVAWDGSMQPPPDWTERSFYYQDKPDIHNECDRWTHQVRSSATSGHDCRFSPIQSDALKDFSRQPDGISLVPRDTVIGNVNASKYGYEGEEAQEILRYTQPIAMNDFEEDWGKLDLNRPENVGIKHETTEHLVQNWVKHKEEQRRKVETEMRQRTEAVPTRPKHRETSNPNQSLLNIYLRPAFKSDLSQMTEIYNWYIENSPRPAETKPIEQEDMKSRLDDVQSSKLPFIVAVHKSTKAAIPHGAEAEVEAMKIDPHPIRNIDPTHKPMTATERVVGWACAQHFTAGDYVEHISAELEVYVDPQYRQHGVGRCLMDKLMEACDRGHMRRGGYQFHCPGEYIHLYTYGGGCDLHKLVFILRKWKYPKPTSIKPVAHKHAKAKSSEKKDDQENDYDTWLRKWLESWEFEVEGVLKGAGAKDRRFVDVVHLSRETRWQPAEGKIPDPFPI